MANIGGKYADAACIRGGGYTKDELRAMLPEPGERRVERCITALKPGPCTVIEVNKEHYWYRVRFDGSGNTQCYKLPRVI